VNDRPVPADTAGRSESDSDQLLVERTVAGDTAAF